ncbi:MAG: methyltransferase domain-containing protein [Chitinophagaceae bacterium]|nr:methyltransferase domain-containing protein [Chitinophagaceae bacterium]
MNPSNSLNAHFWQERYQQQETGWDVGDVSTPLKEYIDQLTDKELRILIPGCGNAHEADYLISHGFNNITLIDLAEDPVMLLRNKYKNLPEVQVLHGDFFEHQGNYDLILEQTFFCALPPAMRREYVQHMYRNLALGGKLAGVMFCIEFEKDGPPFGGSVEEYKSLFEPIFSSVIIEPCYNSIPSRKGHEVFLIAQSKSIG